MIYRTVAYLLAGLFILLLPVKTDAQDESPEVIEWVEMDKALEKASLGNKKILIDVYREGCPYCQKMQEEVYPHENVEEQLRKYFIPVRIDSESSKKVNFLGTTYSEAGFAYALQYSTVPTTFFMNKKGEIVGQQPGYLPVHTFSRLLEFVGSDAYLEMSFSEYER